MCNIWIVDLKINYVHILILDHLTSSTTIVVDE